MFQMFIMILMEEGRRINEKNRIIGNRLLEATKKMLKFSKKEEKKSRKQRLQKKMKMRKFEYEVSVKICKKGEILAVSFFRIKENACRTSAAGDSCILK